MFHGLVLLARQRVGKEGQVTNGVDHLNGDIKFSKGKYPKLRKISNSKNSMAENLSEEAIRKYCPHCDLNSFAMKLAAFSIPAEKVFLPCISSADKVFSILSTSLALIILSIFCACKNEADIKQMAKNTFFICKSLSSFKKNRRN